MLQEISIDQLVIGMYVNRVIAQSGELPIRSKGFVKTQSLIDKLKAKGISALEIDTSKGVAPSEKVAEDQSSAIIERPINTPQSMQASLNVATELYEDAKAIQEAFINTLKSGGNIDINDVNQLSNNIIECVFDNTDAIILLSMLKRAEEYFIEHSIDCTILMALFMKFLGYDSKTTEDACLGALLMDIGMADVPSEIVASRQRLSPADWSVIKSHVDIGLMWLEQYELPSLVTTIIAQHHERLDGSGYPKGLKDDDITVVGRIAAIVDCYDAMISKRAYHEALPPARALKRLADNAGLDQVLVKQFIQCIGLYPVGSLVKLSNGRLAIVTKANDHDLLSPVVMSFYNISGGHYNEIKQLDLSKVDTHIVTSVTPQEFNLDLPKFFTDIFVHQLS